MPQESPSPAFDIEEARRVLGDVFAPWVQDLNLSIERIDHAPPQEATSDWQPGAVLRMPFSERLCRHGGIICGQALMSLADTAMVFAVSGAVGAYIPMTTVDQSIHFLRPAANADVLAEARVVRAGKTMAFGSVTLKVAGDERPVAMAQTAYALMRDAK